MTFTLGTICARGGSRGVPGKNIRNLSGHPLIAYTIATALRCSFLDRLIVSTDSEDIAAVSRRYGAEVPFLRPAELASDASAKLPAIQHAVREIESRGVTVDLIVDLEPTAPLRTVADVLACWRLVQDPETDIAFTVTPADKNPYFNLIEIVEGYAQLSKAPWRSVVRRQDAPAAYGINGAVYAYHRDYLFKDGRVIGPRSRAVVMPIERGRDVDTLIDFAFIEFLVEKGIVQLPEV